MFNNKRDAAKAAFDEFAVEGELDKQGLKDAMKKLRDERRAAKEAKGEESEEEE